MITLKWHGELPTVDLDVLNLTVLTDIKKNLSGLAKPSSLIFHTVFLGEDYDGPNVCVWGEEGDDDHFHCEYYAEAVWESIKGETANV